MKGHNFSVRPFVDCSFLYSLDILAGNASGGTSRLEVDQGDFPTTDVALRHSNVVWNNASTHPILIYQFSKGYIYPRQSKLFKVHNQLIKSSKKWSVRPVENFRLSDIPNVYKRQFRVWENRMKHVGPGYK